MRIDVRAAARLRGHDPINLMSALAPVVGALQASTEDLSRVRVVCDWIQYRASFREPADYRPVLAAGWRAGPDPARLPGNGPDPGTTPETALEIAVDLRRAGPGLGAQVTSLLAEHASPGRSARLPLEPWGPCSASCIWRFNTLYWQALSFWEQATGREYEKALPGGESAARNSAAVRELILELFKVWDDLDARGALPAELYVVELGVGNGSQARTWLDEFATLSGMHSRDYYRRLHYLMGDYSPHVLGRAAMAVAHHGDRVNALVVDATHPAVSLGFLRGKAFLVYISNVYDNLPGDEVARIGGHAYQVEVRAFLPSPAARRIARRFGFPAGRLRDIAGQLLRLGPELLCEALPQHFTEPGRAAAFWRELWNALRLQERYVPLEGFDLYRIGPYLTGETLRSQLESDGDIRMHVNNGALSSFADTLPLLHPFGRLICHDLFVTDVRDYSSAFYGPGKYDGSVVNWVNGPLLRHIGSRAGFDVRISPFAQRPAANVRTLTATVRE
jgi:hypothetical protein